MKKLITPWALIAIQLTIVVASLVGYVKCVYKLTQCDFKGPYKAEVIYGIGSFTGLGAIVGYMDFEK